MTAWNPASKVTGCSFHQSRGMCIYLTNSRNVTIQNNVITRCAKYGVALFDKNNMVYVDDNLLAGIT